MSRTITSVGKITDTGYHDIIEKGFCYSSTQNNPILTNSSIWIVSTTDPDGNFTDTVTGLTQSTTYYFRSYAINSIGTGYSSTVLNVKTKGIDIYPTISVSITCNGFPQTVYEMGMSNNLIVSGQTVKNDEVIFAGGNLQQISSPPPPGSNTILSWGVYNGPPPLVHEYDTSKVSPPISVIYSPRHDGPQSWTMTQTASDVCGDPQYTINDSKTIVAVFPFLWVLKDGTQFNNGNYYSPPSRLMSFNYFFYQASASPTSYNGKLIEEKGPKIIYMAPSDLSHSYLSLGYPSYYGSIEYSLDGSTWGAPGTNLITTTVNTGNYSMATPWSYTYNILQHHFQPAQYSSIPIPFYIRFV